VAPSLLKIETEYFNTVRDQQNIIEDQIQTSIRKNGDSLVEWINMMNLEKIDVLNKIRVTYLRYINMTME
jgi:hypothetical protein